MASLKKKKKKKMCAAALKTVSAETLNFHSPLAKSHKIPNFSEFHQMQIPVMVRQQCC